MRCVAHSNNDETFDLSPLTLLGRSHRASVSPAVSDSAARSATFYINVCWPLAQQDDVHCPPEAAACQKDSANKFIVSCFSLHCSQGVATMEDTSPVHPTMFPILTFVFVFVEPILAPIAQSAVSLDHKAATAAVSHSQ